MRFHTIARVMMGVTLTTFQLAAASSDDQLKEFTRGTERYAELRRDIEQRVPTPQPSDDYTKILAARTALAEAIRRGRPSARVGDIFTLDTGIAIRTRIRGSMTTMRLRASELLGPQDAEDLAAINDLKVNDYFAWDLSGLIPGTLIDALPPLPDVLEYRLVGTTLVLVDLDASLVVDVLRDALPLEPRDVVES
jgi:hypothetical protein